MMSSHVYLLFPPCDRKSPRTLSDCLNQYSCLHTPGRRSARNQSINSRFPPRPRRTEPSRFSNMIRFGNRPPPIRMNTPTYDRLLVCNVVSMHSHPVVSRAWLYEVIRWSSSLLHCAPIMRSKTRSCTARSLK